MNDFITEIMKQQCFLSYFIVSFYGLFVGSFLNVVIFRLPLMYVKKTIDELKDLTMLSDSVLSSKMTKGEKKEFCYLSQIKEFNLSHPRSACGACGNQIRIIDIIPIVSYFLVLNGKCRNCNEKISIQYPIVEIVTSLYWCLSFYLFGATYEFLLITAVMTALFASLVIDIRYKILPDEITLFGLIAGFYFSATSSIAITNIEGSIYGAVFSYFVMRLFVLLYEKVRNKKDMMGIGDMKLYAMCGAWVGIENIVNLITISAIIGIISFVFIRFFDCILNKKKLNMEYRMPFGPCIIFALFYYLNFFLNHPKIVGFDFY